METLYIISLLLCGVLFILLLTTTILIKDGIGSSTPFSMRIIEEPLLQIWSAIMFIVLALCPILNTVTFVVTAVAWGTNCSMGNWKWKYSNSKFISKIRKILTIRLGCKKEYEI